MQCSAMQSSAQQPTADFLDFLADVDESFDGGSAPGAADAYSLLPMPGAQSHEAAAPVAITPRLKRSRTHEWEMGSSKKARLGLRSLKAHHAKRKKVNERRGVQFADALKRLKPRCRMDRLVMKRVKRGPRLRFAVVARTQNPAAESHCEPFTYIEAAFQTEPSISNAALQLGVARPTGRRMRLVMAKFVLESQLDTLGVFITLATARAPLTCITREAWGEAGHSCVFRSSPSDSRSGCRARWELMVLRMSLVLVWDAAEGLPPLFHEFVIPPVVLPSSSAANMFYSLRRHPSFSQFQARLHNLRSLCKMKGYLLETDAAYANERLAFFLGNAPKTLDHLISW